MVCKFNSIFINIHSNLDYRYGDQDNDILGKRSWVYTVEIISSRGVTHVYVHPDLVLLAYISYAVQRVKCTMHCGSCCAANKKWHCTLERSLVSVCNPVPSVQNTSLFVHVM